MAVAIGAPAGGQGCLRGVRRVFDVAMACRTADAACTVHGMIEVHKLGQTRRPLVRRAYDVVRVVVGSVVHGDRRRALRMATGAGRAVRHARGRRDIDSGMTGAAAQPQFADVMSMTERRGLSDSGSRG